MMLLKLKLHIASALQRITGARSRLAHQDSLLAEMSARLVRQDSLLAEMSARLVRQDALLESCMLRMSKIENESDGMLKHLTTQYQSLVQERDALLNERDRLLVSLQRAARPGGFAPDSAQVHTLRLDFPSAALPAGTVPKVYIVDIGAQELTQEEHIYLPLMKAGAARITGFEPLQHAAEKRAAKDLSLTMLNHFIGDGSDGKFHVNRDEATSSLLPADLEFLGRFEALATMCLPIEIKNISTTKLDDIPEVEDCDFLKIDVQGGELDVLRGAGKVLATTVVVHCEVEFSRVYKNQPLFGDIDAHMRAAGFELLDIINAGYASVKGLPRPIAALGCSGVRPSIFARRRPSQASAPTRSSGPLSSPMKTTACTTWRRASYSFSTIRLALTMPRPMVIASPQRLEADPLSSNAKSPPRSGQCRPPV
jgi:FkbM family methyltransferase